MILLELQKDFQRVFVEFACMSARARLSCFGCLRAPAPSWAGFKISLAAIGGSPKGGGDTSGKNRQDALQRGSQQLRFTQNRVSTK